LLAAWVFSFAGKNKIALLLGVVASALMIAFLFRHTIIASEAPTYAKIIGYGAGYWLWLTSAGPDRKRRDRTSETKAIEANRLCLTRSAIISANECRRAS
jgi:hypothetical protein